MRAQFLKRLSLTPAVVERHLSRLATIVVVALALLIPTYAPIPSKLPAVALGSDWVLFFERAGVILLTSLLLGAVAVRGLVSGRLPSTLSREGVEWTDAAEEWVERADALQAQVDALGEEIDVLARQSGLRQ